MINKLDILNEFSIVKKEYDGNIEQMYVDFVKMRFFINQRGYNGEFAEFINEVIINNKTQK